MEDFIIRISFYTLVFLILKSLRRDDRLGCLIAIFCYVVFVEPILFDIFVKDLSQCYFTLKKNLDKIIQFLVERLVYRSITNILIIYQIYLKENEFETRIQYIIKVIKEWFF